MKLSISRSQESIWVWLLWTLGIYLVLELGPFFIAARVLRETAGKLSEPYMAFAVPAVISMPLIWWLRKWEEQGASPKRLAHGWGLSMALFVFAQGAALFYSGIKLRLIERDFIGGFVAAELWGVLIVYFSMYLMALRRLSARAAARGSSRPE